MSGYDEMGLRNFFPWFSDCHSVLVYTLVLYQSGVPFSGSFDLWGSRGGFSGSMGSRYMGWV